MKILHVVHSFVPYTMAGTEVYSYNLAKEQARQHEVFVFFRINNIKEDEYSLLFKNFSGLKIYTINHTFRTCNSFRETYKNDIIDTKFSELLDEIKPDIVHIHHLLFLSCGIIIEIKKRGIPIVFTLHDYWLICYRGQLIRDDLKICEGSSISQCSKCLKYLLGIKKHSMYLYRILRNRIPGFLLEMFKRIHLFMNGSGQEEELAIWRKTLSEVSSQIDLFVSPSQFLKKKFIESGFLENKILYCTYGFDYKKFTSVIKKESYILRFGYIGTLLPTKGLDVLMSAFKEVKNKDVELLIYGKLFSYIGFESYPKVLRKYANKDNRIKLKGEYTNKSIAKIFSNIDILVVPSIWPENSPLVIQEAFLSRTPVIASRIGGIPELVIDGINGLLFKAGDKEDLKNKIEYLIANPALVEKFKANMPEIKNIADNAREIGELYERLIIKEKVCV